MSLPRELQLLMAGQEGVVSRRQAREHGVAAHDVRRLVRRREWAVVHPGVYVDHTGPLTWLQRAWAAVLYAWPAALCGTSVLQSGGLVVHVAIDAARKVGDREGVRVHRTRHFETRVQWNLRPPRMRYEDSVLDVAADARDDLAAVAVLADACGSRRTTAGRLRSALEARSWSPRRRFLLEVLADVEAGACSVLEHGYATRVERAHGLPSAVRQRREVAGGRVVYRDAAYGDFLVELDGRLVHGSAEQRDRDMDRDLDAAVLARSTVRLGYGQVFRRPCVTAGRLAVVLRARGWAGSPIPCGPACQLDRVWSPDVTC
jgi:hypothetical protein